ncbi:MAG TPA: SRPBCC family protein [Micromonospora sp.]|nr:SRPBCC family protein [Micromonospora sp.]
MPTVTVTRLIDAPTARVWRVFTDLPARFHWLSTVEAVEVLTPEPFGTGTIWRETRTTADGTPVTEEFRVEEAIPTRRFTVASPGIGANYRMTYTFTSVEVGRHRGRTLVTVVQEGSPTGPYGRFLALVFGGLAARAVEGALRQDLVDLAAAATRTCTDPAEAA